MTNGDSGPSRSFQKRNKRLRIPLERRQKLTDLETLLKSEKSKRGESHPRVKAIVAHVESMYEQIEDDSIGFPNNPDKIERFPQMLREAVPFMPAEELKALEDDLRYR